MAGWLVVAPPTSPTRPARPQEANVPGAVPRILIGIGAGHWMRTLRGTGIDRALRAGAEVLLHVLCIAADRRIRVFWPPI